MAEFLKAEVYKPIIGPIKLGKIVFTPDSEIKIITEYEGGGFGFSPLILYKITIKNGEKTKTIEEHHLYEEKTTIKNFIIENVDVLFMLISKID